MIVWVILLNKRGSKKSSPVFDAPGFNFLDLFTGNLMDDDDDDEETAVGGGTELLFRPASSREPPGIASVA